MTHVGNSWLTLVLLVLVLRLHAGAQIVQFLPEVDAYYKLNTNLRICFQAKETREGGGPTAPVTSDSSHWLPLVVK